MKLMKRIKKAMRERIGQAKMNLSSQSDFNAFAPDRFVY